MLELLRHPRFLIGLLTIIGGLEISMVLTKLPRLFGIIFIAAGVLLIYLDIRVSKRPTTKDPEAQKAKAVKSKRPRLSQRLVSRLSLDRKLVPYFWVLGIVVIIVDLAINLSGINSEIGSFDVIVLAFGATLILYAPLSKKYPTEMDFLMVFFALLILILIIPIWIWGNLSENTGGMAAQQDLVYTFLTAPLNAILTVLGIESSAQGLYLRFVTADGESLTIGIAASCAGIFSFSIFLSAFLSFVLSEFSTLTRRIALLLGIGILFTYAANLLRMTIVILAGHYNGMGVPGDPAPFTLLWTHTYAGEIIFVCWVALFWWIAFNYFAPEESDGKTPIEKEESEDPEATAEAPEREIADAPSDLEEGG